MANKIRKRRLILIPAQKESKALFFFLITFLAAFYAAVGSNGEASESSFKIIIPPRGSLYHGVFPGGWSGEEDDISIEELSSYEQAVGKTAAWIYFSNNWYKDRNFPRKTATMIRESGSVPFIRLMLRDSDEQNKKNRLFTLQRILEGSFDKDLRAWARTARDFGSPLLAEYGTEVNGEWFPWNGKWSGAGKTKEYGERDYPDGPERFRDAFRHIIDIARQEGALNISWVFHVNNDDVPNISWNRLENYYPGDGYIDLIGVSVYGAQTPMAEEWPEFRESMDSVYPRLQALAPEKPIILLEFGVTLGNPLGDQAAWAKAALTDLLQPRWPGTIGFSWWNEAWENDADTKHNTTMRVQDNKALSDVFRKLVGENEKILGRLNISTLPSP